MFDNFKKKKKAVRLAVIVHINTHKIIIHLLPAVCGHVFLCWCSLGELSIDKKVFVEPSFEYLTSSFSSGLALNYILQNNFQASVGMRPDSRKIGVLITDGKSQDDIIGNSQTLKDQGIELYAIGQ